MKKITLLLICSFFIQTTFSQGNSVATADQFCSGGSGLVFPNVTGNPNDTDVGCLYSIPNPAYYFLQIEQPGDLFFTISQETATGTGLDVDFISWGPFPSLAAANAAITLTACTPTACPNNTTNPTFYPYATDDITDCSFSIAPTEDMTINSGLSGQIYVVLITNFSDNPGFITLQQTGGTGTTSCADIPVCGGNFYDSGGNAGSYSNNETTTTTIYPDTVGGTVTLDFTTFNVLSGDNLTVYNGPDNTFPSLGAVTSAPASFSSTDATGTLTFVFTSNASGVGTGWETDVTCTTPPPPPTCGTNFYDIGGNSRDYLNNETTTTTISPTATGGTVTVDFTAFNILVGDVLTVYDGPDATSPSLGNVTTAPSSYTSTNAYGDLTFVFTSNSSGTSDGWEADVSCTIPPTCSSFFFDSGGSTGSYTNNELTTTTFYPDIATDAVTVTFTLFNLEFADDLYVYDGPNNTSTLLGVFNGTTVPGPFTSSHPTGALTFVFDSDSSVTYDGWEASISCAPYVPPVVCGTTFYDSGGAGANYSNDELTTTTFIPDIPGTSVTATFTTFNTEAGYDELSVYDGPNATYPLLGTFSGTVIPGTFTSSDPSGALTFVFDSDVSGIRSGWAADITCTTDVPTCGETFYDSGGVGGNYGNSENETTTITPLNVGDAVTTTFTAFNLAVGDTLEVFDGATSLGTFTGTTIPGPFTATNPSGALTFTFTSNGSATQSGWAADITCSILCNMTITETTSPIGADDCTLIYTELIATASGGAGGTNTLFSDDFSSGISGWTVVNATTNTQWLNSPTSNAGGTASEAFLEWDTGFDNGTWTLTSTSININTYTNLQLDLRHAFNWYSAAYPHSIYIETSPNNATWTTHHNVNPVNADIAATNLNLDISAQDGNPTLYIRFRFTGETFGMISWSIDDVVVFGDAPIIPQITWAPIAGLYTDTALTTPYTGGFTDIVYAAPNGTQTYTATDQNNCTIDATVTRNSKIWMGYIDNNWYIDGNWQPNGVPTASNCVLIPDIAISNFDEPIADIINLIPLPPQPAYALNLTVAPTANLEVGTETALIVTDWVHLDGTIDIRDSGSLIQITDGATNVNNNTGNGTINMQRTATIASSYDYIYWSSPVEGFGVSNVSPGSTLIYEWIPTIAGNGAGNYGNWQATTENMINGKGYIIRNVVGTPTPSTPEFIGKPNNGIITKAITRGTYTAGDYLGGGTTIATRLDDNWNLIGNPYPSAISADTFIATNAAEITDDIDPSISGTVYLWRHLATPSNAINDPFYEDFVYNYNPNDYIAYNTTGSNPSGFGSHIAAGQSFFVLMEDTAPVNSNVTFNNTMRNAALNNSQFYRESNEVNRDSNIEKHRIWLDLISPNNTANSILVGYVAGASNNLDRLYDGFELSETSTRFYSIIETEAFGIQGRALPFENTDLVPLGIVIPENGNYSIAINTLDGLFQNTDQAIFIEDTYTNTIHNLRINPFSFNIDAGTYNDRFILRYTDQALSIDEYEVSGLEILAPSNSYIKVKSGNSTIKTVVVYDLLGRILINKTEINASEIRFNNPNFSEGTYMVKAILSSGKQKIQKVVLKH
ncbi:MAG: T9SS type A sorting domain-containing protein [Oceanihabitans sp.]|nr:T9SS type A sorting domain-containing protein [Oceanihabitans sp.]